MARLPGPLIRVLLDCVVRYKFKFMYTYVAYVSLHTPNNYPVFATVDSLNGTRL